MLPRVKIKGKTIRSRSNNKLNIEDKESLENLNINRLTKVNISDKVLEDHIYLSKAPKTDIKILTLLEKGSILEPSTSLNRTPIFKDYASKDPNLAEELKLEHKFKVKSSELGNEVTYNVIEVPKSKVRNYYEKTDNNNKILDTLEQKGGIFRLSQEDEIIEFIDISCKLEKAIENNFDKNWFLHKISDKSQSYGKADLLLSNSETGESISLQLKLKESTMSNIDLLKLGQVYKDTDIIIIGFKNKEVLEEQIKIVEYMSKKISPKIHFVDLNPYYNDEESYYNYDKILHIIKESRLNRDQALYFEEQYDKKFESLEPITKEERSLINSKVRWTLSQDDINIRPNIVEPTVIKKEYICREYSIKDDQHNFKSKFNNAINGNDIIANRDDKFNQD